MGTGFERIKEICKKENSPFPEIEFNENYFYVTFRQSEEYLKLAGEAEKVPQKVPEKVTIKVTERVTERVTEKQRIILEKIKKDRFITAKHLAVIVGISERKIKENIKKLKDKGLLKRLGPSKGGYWEILEK